MAKTTLTGASEQTDWFDLRAVADSVCFTLTGDFVNAVGIRYSNNEAQNKGTDYNPGTATYSAAVGPLRLPFGIAKFVAFFSGVSWSAGKTCTVRFAMAKDPNGQLVNVTPQGTGGTQGTG